MHHAFVAPLPLPSHHLSRIPAVTRRRITTATAPTPSQPPSQSLYQVLGITSSNPKSLPHSAIRSAYLTLAKTTHPDTSPTSHATPFDEIAHAWTILGDPHLRSVYDASGQEGLDAIQSISQRADEIRNRYADMDGDQLDFLSDTGQLVGSLLSAAPEDNMSLDDAFDPALVDHDDACPRSVEEAIWNITNHEDRSVRYYGLWWIYKFKVSAAEHALVQVLNTSSDRTALGGFGIRRRAALALGAVASAPNQHNEEAALALLDALRSPDYFLRYRAAEALANIAQRHARNPNVAVSFPDAIVQELKQILERGKQQILNKEAAKTGYSQQESLFDLDKLDPDVRQRLEKIFQDRRQNEQMSRRTTMTPQLGVDEVGVESDEPLEWVMKAVSAICATQEQVDDQLVQCLQVYTSNSIPLVRYAAHKALYALTKNESHAEEIVDALRYGIEHHYSQRVLIRDLGDLGYCQGAAAVASCPMVENSFKILALKNMLAKHNHDPKEADVRNVLMHMDSLL